jgi:putative oxidoreductase
MFGMTVLQRLARPMLAGIFIYGGLDSARAPDPKVPAADKVVGRAVEQLGARVETAQVVRANGVVQVVAGTALALGVWARPAAAVLAASLVPTTLAGHRFWDEEDATGRHQQRIQFLKNLALMGGLVLAAADTGGRPSLPWRAKRAVGHVAGQVRERSPIPG